MNNEQPLHRKRVKHYDEPGHLHESTFSCYQRRPLLTNDRWREMLAVAIERAIARHQYQLVAFVYMPEHVHLIVYPSTDTCEIQKLLKAIERPFSFRIKRLLVESHSRLLAKLTVRQRPGAMTFRFWQEGPGYDRNLTEVTTALAAIDYVHLNPVRRGLVTQASDWRWSSASWYADPHGPSDDVLPTVHGLSPEWVNQPH